MEEFLFIGKNNKLFRFKFSSTGKIMEFYENYDKNDKAFRYYYNCLLYTSDAADERSSVDLGGRRIIKKKKYEENRSDTKV